MNIDVIKEAIFARTTSALTELMKEGADLSVVRDKLCDAAQFTYFNEDGSRSDTLNNAPVMQQWVLGKRIVLTSSDISILDGSRDLSVRPDIFEDAEVKNLYDMYKTL